jgi:hypothetical protein
LTKTDKSVFHTSDIKARRVVGLVTARQELWTTNNRTERHRKESRLHPTSHSIIDYYLSIVSSAFTSFWATKVEPVLFLLSTSSLLSSSLLTIQNR